MGYHYALLLLSVAINAVLPTNTLIYPYTPILSMEFTVELKERGRITIPIVVVQLLALKPGDFVKVDLEMVKRAD